jgi:DNA transformation protein and related proteins
VDADSIRDLFGALGPVRVRRMFGGQGVFREELMFALEAGGELYLKADESTMATFRQAGSRQFMYLKQGRLMPLNFWTLPDSGLDDPEEAARWGALAVAAARRAAAAKSDKKKPAPRRR